MGAKIRAEHAREAAKTAQRDADRAEAELWSIRMEAYGGPAQPLPTIAQCLNGGLRWLEVECNRCKTRACRSMRSADPEARRSGSWRHR
jgi:hypothetical protein